MYKNKNVKLLSDPFISYENNPSVDEILALFFACLLLYHMLQDSKRFPQNTVIGYK
jgi:hypothetical protein